MGKTEQLNNFFYKFAMSYLTCNRLRESGDTVTMRKETFLYRAYNLYYEGFKNMTIGKTLWMIILIKLFIIFVILKIFFFPDFLKSNAVEGQEAEFVGNELVNRIHQP